MDVKDPAGSVRHPLSGIANGTDAAAVQERAERRPDYGDGDDRPKDIIGPKDHKEPDYADITDVVDAGDYKDIKDFVEPKDFKDIKDFVGPKDFVDIKDIVEPEDYKDIKDFVEPKDYKDVKDFR